MEKVHIEKAWGKCTYKRVGGGGGLSGREGWEDRLGNGGILKSLT